MEAHYDGRQCSADSEELTARCSVGAFRICSKTTKNRRCHRPIYHVACIQSRFSTIPIYNRRTKNSPNSYSLARHCLTHSNMFGYYDPLVHGHDCCVVHGAIDDVFDQTFHFQAFTSIGLMLLLWQTKIKNTILSIRNCKHFYSQLILVETQVTSMVRNYKIELFRCNSMRQTTRQLLFLIATVFGELPAMIFDH